MSEGCLFCHEETCPGAEDKGKSCEYRPGEALGPPLYMNPLDILLEVAQELVDNLFDGEDVYNSDGEVYQDLRSLCAALTWVRHGESLWPSSSS